MDSDLALRRRVLRIAYWRYLDADAAFNAALRDMKSWFPTAHRPYRSAIGQPGSPIRRLYDQRERAVLQLAAARQKLEIGKKRLLAQRSQQTTRRALLITHS